MDPISMLLAAVSALAGCIVFLYTQAIANHRQCIERESKCEQKHDALLERVVAVETERRVYSEIERRIAKLIYPDPNRSPAP